MQRQSLGSPVSKLHSHGGAAVAVAREDIPSAAEDVKRRDSYSASSLLSEYDDEDRKAAKLHRLSTSSMSPARPSEKFVHLIPLLTALCFLVLYLCSHSPSQTDLAQFNGFKRSRNRIEESSEAMNEIGLLSDLQKSNILAIRGLRNLQEIKKRTSKYQLSRKLGDF